ncbi:hypothetical protein FNV43_RR19393 [Rhamnella rubrinervis]|uniref:Uncharacterized protein n=1 Tax=Rhamnella rubrinervis TaxID=2594499 RepID=A0A8K0GPG4_9ROSA|nr:hypothetical protein FNV43_RR19393 [Rhamnella rubrinervis]
MSSGCSKREFVKLTMSGLSYRLKKKFVGMEFGDLFELATRATSKLHSASSSINRERNLEVTDKGGEVKDVDNNPFPTTREHDHDQYLKTATVVPGNRVKSQQNPNGVEADPSLQVTIFWDDQHRVVSKKAEKSSHYHQYPIKPIGWDLDIPRQHDICSIDRCTERRDWTVKAFRSPVKEVGNGKDRTTDPLAETFVKNDVMYRETVEKDGMVPKEKKSEPQSVEEVGDIMDKDAIEDQPTKDEELMVSGFYKELKVKLKLGSPDEAECNTLMLPLIFEAQPNQPSSIDGDNEEKEISKLEIVEEVENKNDSMITNPIKNKYEPVETLKKKLIVYLVEKILGFSSAIDKIECLREDMVEEEIKMEELQLALLKMDDLKFGKWSPNWEELYMILKVVGRGAYQLYDKDGVD